MSSKLADGPLRGLALVVAQRGVVEAGVAKHRIERVCLRNEASPAPDDHRQLRFEIELVGHLGHFQRRTVRQQGGGAAQKDGRVVTDLVAAFLGMVHVVDPQADDLAWAGHTRQQLDFREGHARKSSRPLRQRLHQCRPFLCIVQQRLERRGHVVPQQVTGHHAIPQQHAPPLFFTLAKAHQTHDLLQNSTTNTCHPTDRYRVRSAQYRWQQAPRYQRLFMDNAV